MGQNVEDIFAAFRDLSSKIYQSINDEFRNSVVNLNRQTDDNVFQQFQGRYVDELKKRLDQAAGKVIETNREVSSTESFQRELKGRIQYLLTQFLLRAKSM